MKNTKTLPSIFQFFSDPSDKNDHANEVELRLIFSIAKVLSKSAIKVGDHRAVKRD